LAASPASVLPLQAALRVRRASNRYSFFLYKPTIWLFLGINQPFSRKSIFNHLPAAGWRTTQTGRKHTTNGTNTHE
jgi:hypothetical protein